ncbi:unnamed protein product, partial [Rotaria sp. Silwood2]
MLQSISEKIQAVITELTSQELINKHTKEFFQQRDQFYNKLNGKLLILDEAKLLSDKNEELKNNLVQIETGEGKSVTLGATALILALLGFDVFDTLGVTQNIRYGTFNKLCAEMINRN